jgi:uncharacterized membrane protein
MNDRKLAAWQEAGLIDAQTAAAIGAFEASHTRPIALWAVIGIGALTIGLGVISVVAANWEDVPGTVRLAIHFALMLGLGGWLAWRGESLERAQPWGFEAALFVLGVLGVAFFGHIGQVYQTSSPLWQPLAVWLALFAPLILLRGQSWLTALLLAGTLVYACWDYAGSHYGIFDDRERAPDAWIAFITALPVALAPLGAWMRERSARRAFWKRLEQLALVYAVGGASLICILAGVGSFTEDAFSGDTPVSFASQAIRAGVALLAAALVAAARRRPSGEASAAVLAGAGLASIVAVPVSGSDLMGGVLFMALWVGIAAAALHAGWRGVFQLAVGVIALRLIVLSFELASDLLTSGFGLILSGLLILGVAWIAVRVSRQYAPPRQPDEAA